MKPINRPPANANRQIETPEGIMLSMPLADPMARAVAFLIDFIVRGVLLFICCYLFVRGFCWNWATWARGFSLS